MDIEDLNNKVVFNKDDVYEEKFEFNEQFKCILF